MGNSGSQNTVTENILPEEQWAHSFPRSYHSQAKLQFQHKVLPQRRSHLKLRSTNNGEILHSGGTISGRHVRLTKEEENERPTYNARRENDKDLSRNNAFQRIQDKVNNNVSSPEMKSFASEPDLRYAATNGELREKKLKKKYKAPLPPRMMPVDVKENTLDLRRPLRKARLFKTRAETKKQSSHSNENVEEDNRPKVAESKRLSLPVIDSDEFYRELKDATQRYRHTEKDNESSNNRLDSTDKSTREKLKTLDPNVVDHRELKERLITNIENRAKNPMTQYARGEASGKESTTPEMSPSPKSRYHSTQDLHRPKQLFYFGMNEHFDEARPKEDIINHFYNKVDLQNSSASDISSDINSDDNGTFKTGIDLQLRPILPKKQLEIPRFSPAAAWRLLSLDNQVPTTFTEDGCGGTVVSDDVPLLMEEHIEKYSRPFPPLVNAGQRSSYDKSGDSGISGDDPVPIVYCYDDDEDDDTVAKMNVRQNLVPIRSTKKVERTSWTPQQDLEDDSSAEEEHHNKLIKPRGRTHAGPHIFSLSLPRENRLRTFMTGNVNTFQYTGLNKFKKSWGNKRVSTVDSSYLEERNDNWFLSKSAPNSLTHAIQSLEKHKTYDESSSNINASTRLMYLPEIDFIPLPTSPSERNGYFFQSKSCENIALEMENNAPAPLQDQLSKDDSFSWDLKRKPKKYTFQSTIRQIEKKRLSDKLSREAEKRERERIRELDAMQKVEEEFQKKRAREKANIRQQLRLFSLDENGGCQSLPTRFENKDRSEPDGAFSSDSSSSSTPINNYLTKLHRDSGPYKPSAYENKLLPSSTKELSEFRQMQREYKDYNSSSLKHATEKGYPSRHTTVHPQVSCNMPKVKGPKSKENDCREARRAPFMDRSHQRKTVQASIHNNCFIPF